MLKQNYRMLAIILAVALLLACAPIAVATSTAPTAPPTFDLLSVNTIIAQTAGAAATQTFVLLPSSTPTPTITRTPTENPTSTPTFHFVVFTPTVPSPTPTLDINAKPYLCRVISHTPADNTGFKGGVSFEAHWQVINTGSFAWDENSADYRYFSGDTLQKKDGFDFNQSVPTGGIIDFVVPMQAPDNPGTYTTTWIIAVGKERFCPLKLTIVVN
jgi:hypothetical protein